MYNIIGTRNIWFIISGLMIVISIVFLSIGGLKLGIDFKGGSLLQIGFDQSRPDIQLIQTKLQNENLGDFLIQPVKDNELIIRTKEINNDRKQEIINLLINDFGKIEEISFETIGPTIGQELQKRSLIAIVIVLIAIILYITWAFRKVSTGPVPSYIYGLAAVIALIHDVIFIVGIFAALGYFFNVEIGTLFVTALLTILGFSVHDTIVVFDRIREKLWLSHKESFEEVINTAINATLVRSLNTSLTTLFVLLTLYLFGGETIKYFVLALIFGIITGTYSSIFIASPLLLIWQRLKSK